VIEAAGGVVLRDRGGTTEVLMVHRPRYDDWSLPKGKLDGAEEPAAAAVREVEEETGVAADLGPELTTLTYRVGVELKRVRWWLMHPRDGDPDERPADREVDIARWVPLPEAEVLLSYADERRILAAAERRRAEVGPPPSGPGDADPVP
jgi:8-oxo-dGTP pyrophosphatase MutT (NUDIX family)